MVRDRSYIWRDGGSTSLLQAGKYQIKKNKMNYLMLSCRLPSIVYLRRPGCDVITGLRESEFAGDHLSLGNLYSQLPPAGDSFSGLQTTWEKHGRAAAGGGGRCPLPPPVRRIKQPLWLFLRWRESPVEKNDISMMPAAASIMQISPLKDQDVIWWPVVGKWLKFI